MSNCINGSLESALNRVTGKKLFKSRITHYFEQNPNSYEEIKEALETNDAFNAICKKEETTIDNLLDEWGIVKSSQNQDADTDNQSPIVKEEQEIPKDTWLEQKFSRFFGYGRAQYDLLNTFEGNMVKLGIIDTTNGTMSETTRDINVGIMNFLGQQYTILKNFLKENDIDLGNDSELFPTTTTRDDNFKKILQEAQKFFYNESKVSDIKTKIKEQWKNKQLLKEHSYLDAMYAYVYLSNFDELLQSQFKKSIEINKNQELPISISDNISSYKYSFKIRNNNLSRGWNTQENRNGIEEMGNLGKILIQQIPKLNHVDGKSFGNSLSSIEAVIAVNSVLEKILSQNLVTTGVDKGIGKIQQAIINNDYIVNYKILQTIFEEIFNKESNLEKVLNIPINDMHILYSLYKAVYEKNPQSGHSFYSIEQKHLNKVRLGYSPMRLVTSALLDVSNMKYLYTSMEDGQLTTTYRKVMNLDRQKFELLEAINIFAISPIPSLLEKYKFQYNPNTGCQFTIEKNGKYITYKVHDANQDTSGYIIGAKDEDLIITENSTILKTKTLSDSEIDRFLIDNSELIGFIQDMTGISLLSGNGQLILKKMLQEDFNSFLGMIKAAAKSATVQSIYQKYNESNSEDSIRKYIQTQQQDEGTKLLPIEDISSIGNNDRFIFKEILSEEALVAVNSRDSWLDTYSKANQFLFGTNVKSVVTDASKNKLPHFSPKFMATNIHIELQKQDIDGAASQPLYFVQNRTAIKSVCLDNEVALPNGKIKKVKDMNVSELFTHAIIDKFAAPLSSSQNSFYVQPTTYADKSKYVTMEVGKSAIITNEEECVKQFKNTIGQYYLNQYNNVIADLVKLDIGITKESTIQEINSILSKYSESQLVKIASSKNIVLLDEVHYQKMKGVLQFNDYLYDSVYTFNNEEALRGYLREKKLQFMNELLSNYTQLPFYKTINESFFGKNSNIWKLGNRFVLAKKGSKYILFGNKLESLDGITINPILEQYFYTQSLLSTNLRYSLTGSEVNIPQKYKPNMQEFIPLIGGTSLQLIAETRNLTLSDIKEWLNRNPTDSSFDAINQLYQKDIKMVRNERQMSLLKRNVPIPATITPYAQGDIKGLSKTMKLAVVKRVKAPVYGFGGNVTTQDAIDGSADLSPYQNRLQNNSLQENSVGSVVKPILHYYDPKTGSAVLLKYAAFEITNQTMRLSKNGRDSLYRMFKKMHNLRWSQKLSEPVDLCDKNNYIFGKYIFKNLTESNNIYYGQGNSNFKIIGMKRDSIGYYTQEFEVNKVGNQFNDEVINKYHLYDTNSNHYEIVKQSDGTYKCGQKIIENIEEFIKTNNLHTIDSIYELWEAMGGLYSKSIIDGKLQLSEASHNVVANFIISYGKAIGSDMDTQDSRNYIQPLKDMFIGCVADDTAVKRGGGNWNDTSVRYNEDELTYMEVGTEYYGPQQDSDHTADESEVSTPSQVVTALDINGYRHYDVSQIFHAFAMQSKNNIELEQSALEEYLRTNNKSSLYDIASRIMIQNLGRESEEGLEGLLRKIKRDINQNTNHNNDENKLPLSHPQLYGMLSSTIATQLTKRAIKQRFTGIGDILCPSYDRVTYYQIDGQKMLFQDIVEEAQRELDTRLANKEEVVGINYYSTSAYHDSLVNWYLNLKQNEVSEDGETLKHPILDSLDSFEPESSINIIINGNRVGKPITLNSLDNYYDLKFGLKQLQIQGITGLTKWNLAELNRRLFLAKQLYNCTVTQSDDYITLTATINGQTVSQNIPKDGSQLNIAVTSQELTDVMIGKIQYQDSILIPNNLKPQQITLNLDGKDISIFDLEEAKNSYLLKTKKAREKLRDVYVEISTKGTYHGKPVQIVKNTKAELIASNIYATKLGVNEGATVFEINRDRDTIFKTKIQKLFQSQEYQMALVKNGGQNVYISFNSELENADTIPFKNVKKEPTGKPNEWYIYALDSNNQKIMLVGIEKIDTTLHIDQKDGKPQIREAVDKTNLRIDKNNNGKYCAYRSYYFVTKQQVTESYVDKKGVKRYRKFERYNFDDSVLSSKFKLNIDPQEKYSLIANCITNLYNTGEYKTIQINTEYSTRTWRMTSSILKSMSTNDTFNKTRLGALLERYTSMKDISDVKLKDKVKLSYFGEYEPALREYYKQMNQEKYQSFKASTNFVASRIPAQCLQSFMAMELIGYSGVGTNEAYVSHFQLFLQGSDLDIDKSYILGYSLDENGIIQGWSNYFDVTSEEAMQASLNLPFPMNLKYEYQESDDGIDISIVDSFESLNSIQKAEFITNIINSARRNNNVLKIKNTSTQETFNNRKAHLGNIIKSFENYRLQGDKKDAALKNFIVHGIGEIIQDISNIISAYTPVSIGDIREASLISPKAIDSVNTDIINPLDIYVMQSENAIGKDSIGIGANGQKSQFSEMYFLNELLQNPETRERALFNWKDRRRIAGRASNNMVVATLNTLPSVNKQILKELENQAKHLSPDISTDDASSQFISAATDNAKELILKKINAGGQFAKCYLFLVTMGYSYKDIVAFMTSPLVEFINNATQENIYTGTNLSVQSLCNMFVKKDALSRARENLAEQANPDPLVEYVYKQIEEMLNSKEAKQYIEDAKQLQQVLKAATDFSFLGRMLGINQGIKSKRAESLSFIVKLGQLIYDSEITQSDVIQSKTLTQEEKDAIINYFYKQKFDPFKWLQNITIDDKFSYQELTAKYYKLSGCVINPYDVMIHIPHFAQMFEVLNLYETIMESLCAKDRIFTKIFTRDFNGQTLEDEAVNQILSGIDSYLIYKFLQKSGIVIPTVAGTTYLTSKGEVRTREENGEIDISSINGLTNFKYYFENVVIPNLQSGENLDFVTGDGNIDLVNNPFLSALYKTSNNGMSSYRLDLDMLNLNSPQAQIQFMEYMEGLQELQKVYINGISVADLFYIYNLIVNKGKGGSKSMTKLFLEVHKNDPIVFQDRYNQFLGELDLSNQDISFSTKDILTASAKTFTSINDQKVPAIRIRNEKTGQLEYYIRNKNGGYEKQKTLKVATSKGQSNLINYNPLGIFEDDYLNSVIRILNSNEDNKVLEIAALLQQSVLEGKLVIRELC